MVTTAGMKELRERGQTYLDSVLLRVGVLFPFDFHSRRLVRVYMLLLLEMLQSSTPEHKFSLLNDCIIQERHTDTNELVYYFPIYMYNELQCRKLDQLFTIVPRDYGKKPYYGLLDSAVDNVKRFSCVPEDFYVQQVVL